MKIESVSLMEQSGFVWLGYAVEEGSPFVLICMSEEEAGRMLMTYSDTGKLHFNITHGQSTEVVEPATVAIFRLDELYRRLPD